MPQSTPLADRQLSHMPSRESCRFFSTFEYPPEVCDTNTLPSTAILTMLAKIEELLADSRVLEAGELLGRVEPIFEQQRRSSHDFQTFNSEFLALAKIVRLRQSEINTAHSRIESHEGWTLLREDKDHTKSYYRLERDSLTGKQLIYIKVDGVVKGAGLLECAAIWKEGSLFKSWLPLCHTSEILAQFSETNLLLKIGIGPPVFGREIVLDCYGDYSHIETNNRFTLVTKSTAGGTQLENNGIKFVVPQESWARPRADVRYLEVIVQGLPPPSPTKSDGGSCGGDGGVRNCAVMCVDPGYELPTWLFERLMKPGASAFLGHVANQAKTLAKANAIIDSMAVRPASAVLEKDKVAKAQKMSAHWDLIRKNTWYAESKHRLIEIHVPACTEAKATQLETSQQERACL